jgi:hypothetical protein
MTKSQHNPSSADSLREIQRRVIAIHYDLSEGVAGDLELQHRTLDRLMALVEHIEGVIDRADMATPAQR